MEDGRSGSRIYLFGRSLTDDRIRDNLAGFGYEAVSCCSAEELLRRIAENAPALLLVDADDAGDGRSPFRAVEGIQERLERPLPVVFLCSRDTIDLRLRAVRAGGEAFFVKPWSITSLVDRIEALSAQECRDPFRVLIVDDDPGLALYHSVLLKKYGMQTEISNNPFEVVGQLFDFMPDLVLMDVHMPGCSGRELAKVIRQMRSFDCVPIVFLSAEKDAEKQRIAMRMGGDDFLTKPVDPDHLISSVAIRAERMRMIRSFMDRDSLTGLLNHSKTKEQLDIALSRAKRMGTPVAFAMLDIDHFKKINDTYGHPVGDTVIVTLARLLQQRLRRTDVVGRYGGEEFAVVLEGLDGEAAARVLDAARTAFEQIEHRAGVSSFASTFSCGIASFPVFAKAAGICSAADRALYVAKHAGRNRVAVA